MSIAFPPALAPGQTIGIMAPSSSIDPDKFAQGAAILEERGYNLLIHPQTYQGSSTGNQLAGAPETKAAAFMDLWTNPHVSGIIAACGGNFATQMLPLLDWDLIEKTPKTLMGFSDSTALLCALHARAGISGFFGPTVQTLTRVNDRNLVFRMIEDKQVDLIPLLPAKALRHGLVEAPLFAATLSVLTALVGTKYMPSLEGHILILEDIGEELSRLDRCLWQLRQVLDFSKLAGVAFGDMVDLKDTGRPFGMDFDDLVHSHTSDVDGPIIINAPIGHGKRLFPIPLSRRVILDTQNTPHLILA